MTDKILKIVVKECEGHCKFFDTFIRNSNKIDSHVMAAEYGKQSFASWLMMRIKELEEDLYDG